MTIIRNISVLIIRNHKLDKKRKDVNKCIKKQCLNKKFWKTHRVGEGVTKSGPHFDENGTKRLAHKSYFYKQVIRCKLPGQTYGNIRVIPKRKKINKKSCLDICTTDARQPIITRRSRSEVFLVKGVLKICGKFTG